MATTGSLASVSQQQRLLGGQANLGDFQTEFGTGLQPSGAGQLSGNTRSVGLDTNLASSIGADFESSRTAQAFDPTLTSDQVSGLKQQRGRAAAGGIFGGAVEAKQARESSIFRAGNRETALGEFAQGAFDRVSAIQEGAQGFFDQLRPQSAQDLTQFEAGDFRSLFQTLTDTGFGDEVRLVLAQQAGQQIEVGDINEEVFQSLSQFVNPQLSRQQSTTIQDESRRLPARFIRVGENTRTVAERRTQLKRGALTEQILATNRQRAGTALFDTIGNKIQDLRIDAQNIQIQHGLVSAAIRRGDVQGALEADVQQFGGFLQNIGLTAPGLPSPRQQVGPSQLNQIQEEGLDRLAPDLKSSRRGEMQRAVQAAKRERFQARQASR